MSRPFDRLIALLKWPIAILSLLALPGLVWALYELAWRLGSGPRPFLPLLVGVLVYVVAWFTVLASRSPSSFFSTMEHELTHALFAWVTLHRVPGFLRTWRSGGHIRYLGRGNWLIAIGPFFWPTMSLAVALLIGAAGHVRYATAILGATLAHHVMTTWPNARRHHSDLREAGGLFCLFFLPGANALVMGSLIAFATGGGRAWHHFLRQASAHAVGIVRLVAHLIHSLF